MGQINKVTSYEYNKISYNHISTIRATVENEIGDIIDKAKPKLPPSQSLQILELLIQNKETLVDLLTVTLDVSDNDLKENLMNIFDF